MLAHTLSCLLLSFASFCALLAGKRCSLAQWGRVCVCVRLLHSSASPPVSSTSWAPAPITKINWPLYQWDWSVCEGMCLSVRAHVCTRMRPFVWGGAQTPCLLSLNEPSGETNTVLPQMNAWDVRPSHLCITLKPSLQGLKTKTITKPYLQFKFS